jgi:hypothetical protein
MTVIRANGMLILVQRPGMIIRLEDKLYGPNPAPDGSMETPHEVLKR